MEPAEAADHFLVTQIRAGDQPAWRQLIERYSGRLLAFARTRTSSLSDAEDLVQETFVGFLQSLAKFDEPLPAVELACQFGDGALPGCDHLGCGRLEQPTAQRAATERRRAAPAEQLHE